MTVDSQGAAMHAVAEMCKAISALPEGVVFNTKLIACELLSNAMKYGGIPLYRHGAKRAARGAVRDSIRSARFEQDARPGSGERAGVVPRRRPLRDKRIQ